jgi:predicted ATPase/class 3 adenylate cyclase
MTGIASLPAGSVTLLFSDTEGSTLLLSRLGDRYVEALDAQRKILRQAWVDCEGTELGTEGDSFYVVFARPTDAVAAVTIAQRELTQFSWPDNESVRVRMGMHTGSPLPHDGAYVGLDVHRAARIASAAHGGQVTLSSTTAELVADALPVGTALRDLGSHRLKDLPRPEHVYQLAIDGVENDFPPLRSLGAGSRLPLAGTPILGRDVELAALTTSIRAAETQLLTLTGPGGAGKTRLALDLAKRLENFFPDGVYFVPLAAVTDGPTMWTSIADVLDIDKEGRDPDAVSKFVRHRHALLVLDNLEQIPQAGEVTAALLTAAPRLVVVATTRRPLHISAEHEFAVPVLELPSGTDLDAAAGSAAVQLFVRQARRVRSTFQLTAANSSDVVDLCRHLDGLPLAIELAAARSKVLSPRAILARLNTVLDIAVHDSDRTARHQTLRDTIAWSYDLLEPAQRDFFCRLGVFADGADLAAVAPVCLADAPGHRDALDLVADIVDASLASVSETLDGEPRITMLDTVRAYALQQLATVDPHNLTTERHGRYYVTCVDELVAALTGHEHLQARARLDSEYANIAAALGWLLRTDSGRGQPEQIDSALHLVASIGAYWLTSGRWSEWVRWLSRTIQSAGDRETADLATCLALLSNCLRFRGDDGRSPGYARASVEMLRRLGGQQSGLPYALRSLAVSEWAHGHLAEARELFEEAISAARSTGDLFQLREGLSEFGTYESDQGNLSHCLVLEQEAVLLAMEAGDRTSEINCRHNSACTLRMLGQVVEAEAMMRNVIPASLAVHEEFRLVSLAEDYAAILAELGDDRHAAQLLGVADAWHRVENTPRSAIQEREILGAIDAARARLSVEIWDGAHHEGEGTTIDDALLAVLQRRPPSAAS